MHMKQQEYNCITTIATKPSRDEVELAFTRPNISQHGESWNILRFGIIINGLVNRYCAVVRATAAFNSLRCDSQLTTFNSFGWYDAVFMVWIFYTQRYFNQETLWRQVFIQTSSEWLPSPTKYDAMNDLGIAVTVRGVMSVTAQPDTIHWIETSEERNLKGHVYLTQLVDFLHWMGKTLILLQIRCICLRL